MGRGAPTLLSPPAEARDRYITTISLKKLVVIARGGAAEGGMT
jgi:hypothetical protein